MVYQILISTMCLHFSNFVLVFMIVGLVGEAVVIAEDFRPLIPPLFLSPDNTKLSLNMTGFSVFPAETAILATDARASQLRPAAQK